MIPVSPIMIDEQLYTNFKNKFKQYINDIDLLIMKGILITLWISVITILLLTIPKLLYSVYMSIYSCICFACNNTFIFTQLIPNIIFIMTLLF